MYFVMTTLPNYYTGPTIKEQGWGAHRAWTPGIGITEATFTSPLIPRTRRIALLYFGLKSLRYEQKYNDHFEDSHLMWVLSSLALLYPARPNPQTSCCSGSTLPWWSSINLSPWKCITNRALNMFHEQEINLYLFLGHWHFGIVYYNTII